jgi:hypothetical protein
MMIHGLPTCAVELCFKPAKCFDDLCKIHYSKKVKDDPVFAARAQQESPEERRRREGALQSLYRIRGEQKRDAQAWRTSSCLLGAPAKIATIVRGLVRGRPAPPFVTEAVRNLAHAIHGLGEDEEEGGEGEGEQPPVFASLAESDAYFTFKLDTYVPLLQFNLSPSVLKQIGTRMRQAAVYVRAVKPAVREQSFALGRAAHGLLQAVKRLGGQSIPGLFALQFEAEAAAAAAMAAAAAANHANGIHVAAFVTDAQNVHTPPAVSSTGQGVTCLMRREASEGDVLAAIQTAIPDLDAILLDTLTQDCIHVSAFGASYKDVLRRVWDVVDTTRKGVKRLANKMFVRAIQRLISITGLEEEDWAFDGAGKQGLRVTPYSPEERMAWSLYVVTLCATFDLEGAKEIAETIVAETDALPCPSLPFALLEDALAVEHWLLKRFQEEVRDGIGMCAQGKMTRLVNVLRGFDEEVDGGAGEADGGAGEAGGDREAFQNRFALLQGQTEEARRAGAEALFVEFAIPASEQGAWLEALMGG